MGVCLIFLGTFIALFGGYLENKGLYRDLLAAWRLTNLYGGYLSQRDGLGGNK